MLVLAFSSKENLEENLDQETNADEVMEEVFDLELQTLHPKLVDGVELLFVDDISHVLGLYQDKTLSVIAMYASIKDTQNPTANPIAMEDICIGFNPQDVKKSLSLPKQH